MRISDWSSDVCSSDLIAIAASAAISPTLRLARALEREVAAIRSTHLRDGDGEEQYRQRAKHDAHRHGAAPLTLAVKREFLGRHDSSILSAINAPKRMNRYSTEKANICLSAAIFAGSVSRLIATRAASSRKDRKSTRLNSSHSCAHRMPYSA